CRCELCLLDILCVVFFQAEDGIRDRTVTGVQTCALPILFRDFHLKFHTERRLLAAEALARTVTVRPESATILYAGDTFSVRETRSEERRVGKECRYRIERDHERRRNRVDKCRGSTTQIC